MAQNDYRPTSWNGEAITVQKLQQMSDNTQFLFERSPRLRYSASGLVRDTALKVISGKSPYLGNGYDGQYVNVYFGSYFTAGCKPVVTLTAEPTGYKQRVVCSLVGIGGALNEVDHNGFAAAVWLDELPYTGNSMTTGGFIHWTAVGY